jgi:hypothetical protein
MATVAYSFNPARCSEGLAAVEADLKQLVSALTDAQFHAPPRAGGWSVGYCIEHLVLTGQAFLSKWDTALQEAAAKGRNGDESVSYQWWHRAILGFAEPPYRLKTKTSQPFLPYTRRSRDETVHRFLSMHQEIAKRLDTSRGFDVRHTNVQSPFSSWIRYPLGFSFDLALAHERRHLWQAWQIRRIIVEGRFHQAPDKS